MFVLLPPTAPDMLPIVGAAHNSAAPNIQRPLCRDLKGEATDCQQMAAQKSRPCEDALLDGRCATSRRRDGSVRPKDLKGHPAEYNARERMSACSRYALHGGRSGFGQVWPLTPTPRISASGRGFCRCCSYAPKSHLAAKSRMFAVSIYRPTKHGPGFPRASCRWGETLASDIRTSCILNEFFEDQPIADGCRASGITLICM